MDPFAVRIGGSEGQNSGPVSFLSCNKDPIPRQRSRIPMKAAHLVCTYENQHWLLVYAETLNFVALLILLLMLTTFNYNIFNIFILPH